jgi:hypothetical protein
VIETQIKAVSLINGDWFIMLTGDLAGRVTGAVYDATDPDNMVPLTTSVSPYVGCSICCITTMCCATYWVPMLEGVQQIHLNLYAIGRCCGLMTNGQ